MIYVVRRRTVRFEKSSNHPDGLVYYTGETIAEFEDHLQAHNLVDLLNKRDNGKHFWASDKPSYSWRRPAPAKMEYIKDVSVHWFFIIFSYLLPFIFAASIIYLW
ncbi:MAG: hypothetical protein OCD03_11215 [Hyphomicrobiales bacterium]